MKQSNILQTKTGNKISAIVIILIISLLTQPACAQTKTKSLDILMGMQYGLSMVIPIICGVILLFLLLIYIFRIISRATFLRWTFSVIIAGAAFYISHILFHIQ
ncbi:conjugal transfer protein [Bartonella sp. ML70XJBT.G]|uniref:conjugal transfer protein n=1 Tax=Bartonella sp. ML70XJBT.G TaxID=3019093 RepID=UPI002360D985|nr:conjugal transfer protein [Bartonella sp. ML70XJBT.G]